jgi:hypothetical protein
MTTQHVPLPDPIPPDAWARMPWSARRRWERRTRRPGRPAEEPDRPEDTLRPSKETEDLTPCPDGYTREQMLAGNRAQDRWKRSGGPEPTPGQRAAYLAYRAVEVSARRARRRELRQMEGGS